MKFHNLLNAFALIFLFLTCARKEKSVKAVDIQNVSNIPLTNDSTVAVIKNKLIFVNECENKTYKATLYEYENLQKDAFVLNILFKDGRKKDFILDSRPGFTTINHCKKYYVVVGMACGGPCYGRDFIFLDKKRAAEGYTYCNIADSNENIITYIQNEEFEKLHIRNLLNGKEKIVLLHNCEDPISYPCSIMKMDVINQNLVIRFDSAGKKAKKKIIDIGDILK
jgi:hypothetical protein